MAVQYLRIQVRRDSKANWSAANPVLLLGEVGYETDTKRSKTGDGVHTWMNLPYDKAGIVAVGEGLTVDEDGVLTNTYDHSEDLGDLGEQTVKAYVDAQDAATLQAAGTYADGAVDVEKAQRMTEDAAIRDDLDVEQTARENRDNNLQGQIDANLVEFQTYSAATGTRLAFLETDHVTGTEVDAVQATALQAVADEETRALAAEAAIQADVDANETASDAANAALSGRLDTLEGGSSVEGSVAEAKKAGDDAKADAAAAQSKADQGVTDAATAQAAADANTAALADKADKASPTFTGVISGGEAEVASVRSNTIKLQNGVLDKDGLNLMNTSTRKFRGGLAGIQSFTGGTDVGAGNKTAATANDLASAIVAIEQLQGVVARLIVDLGEANRLNDTAVVDAD